MNPNRAQNLLKQLFALKIDRHIAVVQEGKKPFQGEICASNFSRKAHLNIHIQSVHEERKPFQCEICDRSFTQKSHITAHNRLFHGDEKDKKRFKCQICIITLRSTEITCAHYSTACAEFSQEVFGHKTGH